MAEQLTILNEFLLVMEEKKVAFYSLESIYVTDLETWYRITFPQYTAMHHL